MFIYKKDFFFPLLSSPCGPLGALWPWLRSVFYGVPGESVLLSGFSPLQAIPIQNAIGSPAHIYEYEDTFIVG